MFGIGGWEFILIAVLALLLFGPDKLPQFARTLGRFMRDFKRYQDLMESTIRAEVFASDPGHEKDAFKTGKEFRERVASGGFAKTAEKEAEAEPSEQPDAEVAETGESAESAEPADDAPATTPDEAEAPAPDGDEG